MKIKVALVGALMAVGGSRQVNWTSTPAHWAVRLAGSCSASRDTEGDGGVALPATGLACRS